MFVGIDWAAQSHDLCVVDDAGRVRDRATVLHTEEGLEALVRRLRRLGRRAEVLVGIERPEGRLVDRILEAGYPIVLVPTFAMKDFRRRYAVGGAKSDRGDAYVIADVARTDGHRLRCLEPLQPQTRALRAAVRTRGELVDQRVALGNQLRASLEAYWPGAAVIFADVTSEIALAFLERYPTPASARRLSEAHLSAFLKKAHYSGHRSPAELLARLRGSPEGLSGVEAEARAAGTRALVRVARSLNASIKDLERSVVAHLGEHPDAMVATSLRTVRSDQRSPDARRVGRLPRSLRPPRSGGHAWRPLPRDPRLGQTSRRELPVGLQQAAPQGPHDLRRQLPARVPLGRQRVRQGHGTGL